MSFRLILAPGGRLQSMAFVSLIAYGSARRPTSSQQKCSEQRKRVKQPVFSRVALIAALALFNSAPLGHMTEAGLQLAFQLPIRRFSSLGCANHSCLPLPPSLRPAVSGRGRHLWPLPQLLGQRGAVHLQRPGGAACADPLEAPGGRQPRRLLREPVPGLLVAEPRPPGPGALLQVEDGDGGLRRQHR